MPYLKIKQDRQESEVVLKGETSTLSLLVSWGFPHGMASLRLGSLSLGMDQAARAATSIGVPKSPCVNRNAVRQALLLADESRM